MATIVDYASLTQAITDFAHRSDMAASLYTDYFIQKAQARICKDIITDNFGNGIEAMEEALIPTSIAGGTVPVPIDWFSPKGLQIGDGSSDVFPLLFKAATWIYDQYPLRQAEGLPAYIARDVMAAVAFNGQVAGTILTVNSITSGIIQVGLPITDALGNVPFGTTVLDNVPEGGVGNYTLNNFLGVTAEAMTGGGNVFIFGPYPDSSYTVQGTYYSKGLPLSNSNTTNWQVLQCPEVLHACCMIEAGKFLKDTAMVQQWTPDYEDGIQSLINSDKGERWAASTMAIELG